jgi:ABC transporter with metal-binding/Fe-S-binding domain ATP-binding protein
MHVCVLFSGGKDSTYALYTVQQYGWDVGCLVTVLPQKKDSYMFHTPNIRFANVIADALEIPIKTKETSGDKETELEDLRNILKNTNVDGVISGAIMSDYQKTRIDRICYDLGIKSFAPLWRKNQEMLIRDMIDAGFRIIVVGVFAQYLNESWLGKEIDNNVLNELCELQRKYKINVAGEGGEIETMVLDGPNFKKRAVLKKWKKVYGRDSGILQIDELKLEKK